MWRSFRKSIVCLMVFSMLIGIIGPSQVRANGRDFNCMSKETILGNGNGFLLSNSSEAATIYIDTSREEISWSGNYEYCGLEIIAETFADDVDLVTNNRPNVVTNEQQLSGNVIIAGTIGNNSIIDSLVQNGIMNVNNPLEPVFRHKSRL